MVALWYPTRNLYDFLKRNGLDSGLNDLLKVDMAPTCKLLSF